jgi:hypothetical protein
LPSGIVGTIPRLGPFIGFLVIGWIADKFGQHLHDRDVIAHNRILRDAGQSIDRPDAGMRVVSTQHFDRLGVAVGDQSLFRKKGSLPRCFHPGLGNYRAPNAKSEAEYSDREKPQIAEDFAVAGIRTSSPPKLKCQPLRSSNPEQRCRKNEANDQGHRHGHGAVQNGTTGLDASVAPSSGGLSCSRETFRKRHEPFPPPIAVLSQLEQTALRRQSR